MTYYCTCCGIPNKNVSLSSNCSSCGQPLNKALKQTPLRKPIQKTSYIEIEADEEPPIENIPNLSKLEVEINIVNSRDKFKMDLGGQAFQIQTDHPSSISIEDARKNISDLKANLAKPVGERVQTIGGDK